MKKITDLKEGELLKNESATLLIKQPVRTEYAEYLGQKQRIDHDSGFDVSLETIRSQHLQIFEFQAAIVHWALKRGRAAVFADTGLGKTFMQLAWAHQVHQYTGNRVLVVAPLCVAQQTEAEARKFGIDSHVRYVRSFEKDGETGIYVTNYEMLEHFEEGIRDGYFDGVVLDESSIIKHRDSKTRNYVIKLFETVPYRLSCTATPSPNDYMELGNQAEFLGVMSMPEMLSTFFIHDSGETSKWRLKGHGKSRFWEWLSTWSACIRKPSDLGFSDNGYNLPGLRIDERVVDTGCAIVAQSLSERNEARRETVDARVAATAEIVNSSSDQWIVWCNLNDESSKLVEAITGAVEVRGSDKLETKEERIKAFTEGRARVLVTKPSIAGFGMNWQHCSKMAFVGLNDSYEQLYQAIRRCYRFGQKREVEAVLITADREGAVRDNIKRKEAQAEDMAQAMLAHMREFTRRRVLGLKREISDYETDTFKSSDFTLMLGDCVERVQSLPDESVGYSIFSPPFSSLYTYTNSDRDMGNCRSDDDFFNHFKFLISELFRVMKTGRNISIHCMNLPSSKQHHGYIGIRDFRGEIIRAFTDAGFIYHSEVCIWKDPVVAMQRTKALGLLWKQLKKDSAMSRQGIPDYLVTFRKPGVNVEPVAHTEAEFPVDLWQLYASPCWVDIRQSNTLNKNPAREDDDERHICPLQLDLIERGVFMWSNPGDTVLSPFAGIGSEGYVSVRMGRKFVGVELKKSYFKVALENLKSAESHPKNLAIPRIRGFKLNDSTAPEPDRPRHSRTPGQVTAVQQLDWVSLVSGET